MNSSYTNLSRLLFSGTKYVVCAFDKYKNCLKIYYALNLLIRDITYKHDLSKDICLWVVESYIYDNFSILMLLLISRTSYLKMKWICYYYEKNIIFELFHCYDLNSASRGYGTGISIEILIGHYKWWELCYTHLCWERPTCGGCQPTSWLMIDHTERGVILSDMILGFPSIVGNAGCLAQCARSLPKLW